MRQIDAPDPQRTCSIFLDLVSIQSESGKERNVASYITEFARNLGLRIIEDDAGKKTGGNSGNLVVKLPPRGFDEIFILNSHMDTVSPCEGVSVIECDGRFESNGETILGADDKAGIAVVLSLIEHLLKNAEKYRGIDAVFTVQEEKGLVGAKNFDYQLLSGRWGLVLDGAGRVGGIVVESPGQESMKFTLRGLAAHAGVEPEKGKNSIVCASKAISNLNTGRIDEKTTSNIGLIHGGEAVNIVPELTVVCAEVRSFEERRLKEERERIIDSFKRAARECGCGLEIETERSFHHFKIDKRSRRLKELTEAIDFCGLNPSFLKSGGGSDASVFNNMGYEMITIDIGVENAHSPREWIRKDDLTDVSRIVNAIATCKAK
ncbi:MAG: M20/M25/M40 family metallo-hydrolase [Actinomycetota bacterium]|nr:M20/M25/M40 family metallo-hydrolase [Actinomycetota bacterium]